MIFARLIPAGFLAAALLAPGLALAFDVKEAPPAPPPKGGLFRSVGDSIKESLKAFSSGQPESAVEPLTYAAREGNVAAQFRLGRMYADGEGVRRDDLKAYQHFSEIVDKHANAGPEAPNSRVVAQAFVALGGYHLNGIPSSRVKRDPHRAAEMFHHAASYFDDPDAQYHLGKIFSEGLAGPRDAPKAARWFFMAAEKGHPFAQARLGQMLFNGDGVPKQAPRGLMWLSIASKKADPARDAWVIDLNTRARDIATEDERRISDAYARKFERAASR